MPKPKGNEVIESVVKVLAETLKHLKQATHYVDELHEVYKAALNEDEKQKQEVDHAKKEKD